MRLKNILNEMNFLIARCEAVSKVILFFQKLTIWKYRHC